MVSQPISLKNKVIKFIKKESNLVIQGANVKYRPMLYMAFGTLLRVVQSTSEAELRVKIKILINKKQQIYQMLEDAKEGKLEVKDKNLKKVYPYLMQLLQNENNVIKKVIDDFYREFENEVKDSKNG